MADRVLPAASGKVLLAEDLAIIWTFFFPFPFRRSVGVAFLGFCFVVCTFDLAYSRAKVAETIKVLVGHQVLVMWLLQGTHSNEVVYGKLLSQWYMSMTTNLWSICMFNR